MAFYDGGAGDGDDGGGGEVVWRTKNRYWKREVVDPKSVCLGR